MPDHDFDPLPQAWLPVRIGARFTHRPVYIFPQILEHGRFEDWLED
jgi:hypothetical protein